MQSERDPPAPSYPLPQGETRVRVIRPLMRHTARMTPKRGPSRAPAPYVVFDLETKRLSSEVRGGWRNIQDFGLAVGVTIDHRGKQRVWKEADAQDLIDHLAKYPCVVGFNSRRFDLTVLSAYGSVDALHACSFDVLLELQAVTGRRKGMSLQNIAHTMFQVGKSLSDGTEAVRLWRRGRPGDRQRVIDYCAQDVELTKRIFDFGVAHGYVLVPVPDLRRGGPASTAKVTVDWSAAPFGTHPPDTR